MLRSAFRGKPSASRTAAWPFAIFSAVLVAAGNAAANPRPLPFTYPYETLGAEQMEIEQYIDTTPLKTPDPDNAGGQLWDQGYRLQTEFEYGITDRLELGLYFVYGSDPGGPLVFDGIKQRLRFRLAEQGEWPVDVALYGEIAEFHDEFEIEEKLILTKRLDKIRIMTNLWFEQELEHYSGGPEVIFHPTFGVTGEVAPVFHVGAEYWAVGKFENEGAPGTPQHFNDSFHHFVGPAVSLQFGRLWWSTAAYLRLDEMKRAVELEDKYGHLWVRSVIGLAL